MAAIYTTISSQTTMLRIEKKNNIFSLIIYYFSHMLSQISRETATIGTFNRFIRTLK